MNIMVMMKTLINKNIITSFHFETINIIVLYNLGEGYPDQRSQGREEGKEKKSIKTRKEENVSKKEYQEKEAEAGKKEWKRKGKGWRKEKAQWRKERERKKEWNP